MQAFRLKCPSAATAVNCIVLDPKKNHVRHSQIEGDIQGPPSCVCSVVSVSVLSTSSYLSKTNIESKSSTKFLVTSQLKMHPLAAEVS